MAEIKLKVPLLAQGKTMSCWYASTMMLKYYYRPGPRLGMPQVWIDNNGLNTGKVAELAKIEHMKFLPSKDHDFTSESLIATIKTHGPIWTACSWKGYGHVVVTTGCSSEGEDGGTVYINDPEPVGVGSEVTVSIKTFNEKRLRGLLLVDDE